MSRFVTVAETSEIPAGECKSVDAEGTSIAICNVDGNFYALAATCLHKGGPLAEGCLDGHTLTCPWHAWDFDVRTGETSYDMSKQKTYPVRVSGTKIEVDLEPGENK